MTWLIITLAILMVIIIILFFPIKIRVTGSLTELGLFVFGIRVYHKRKDLLYQEVKETTKKPPRVLKFRARYLKLLQDIKFKDNQITIGGYQTDYGQGAIIFGYSNAILSNLKNYLNNQNIPLHYQTYFIGPFGIKYNSIFTIQVGKILYKFFRLRRL